MSKKIRYTLIAIGFVIFAIAVPLIVLFVRGIKYDFEQNKFVPTGIISINSDPKEVDIYLDGKLVGTNAGEIRFLEPKTYQLILKKEGYFDWTKQLTVEPSMATWVTGQGSKATLLLKEPLTQEIQKDVLDFTAWPKGVMAITPTAVQWAKDWDNNSSSTLATTKKISSILASPDFKKFLLTYQATNQEPVNVLFFDSEKQQLFDLKNLFEPKGPLPPFMFSEKGDLYALFENNLYKISPQNSTRQLVLGDVVSPAIHGQTVYYLKNDETKQEIYSLNLETSENVTLFKSPQKFSSAEILVNSQKQIFLLADGELYTAGPVGLIKMADPVNLWRLDEQSQTLAFLSSNELRYIDYDGQNIFVNRSVANLTQPLVKPDLGYAFYVKGGNLIIAEELSTKGQKNIYTLYKGDEITEFTIDNNSRRMLILDKGALKLLKFR